MERKPKKKRISLLLYYPLVLVICAVGVLVFSLTYTGGGALPLLTADAAAGQLAPADGGPQPGDTLPEGATQGDPATPTGPTPDPDSLQMTTTPTPLPAISLEGRLFPYRYGELWGYKNAKGDVVIEPKYLRALEFTDGLYAFAAIELNGQLRYGMITRSGSWAAEPAWSNVQPFSEGYAAVEMEEKWGYINESGKLVIPCKYREAKAFHNGRAAVREASNFGYIDPDGDLAVPASFSSAGDFSSDMAFVMQGDKCYLIDKVGKKITSWGSKESGELYSGGYAAVKVEGGYAYFDANRKRKYTGFEGARPFSEKLAAVKKEGKWGYINESGSMVIEPQYEEALDFSQRRAAVRDASGKWGYIDSSGILKVDCQYDEAGPFLMDCALVKKGSEVGIIDSSGNYIPLYT